MNLMMTMVVEGEQGVDDCVVPNWRCILVHKQRTSARTRFLCVGRDVVFPEAPDDACGLSDPDEPTTQSGSVLAHPASGLPALADQLGLSPGALQVEGPPLGRLLDEEGTPPVWLVEVVTTDPPFDAASSMGGRFISIMEARHVPVVQRDLLRRAYERVLG